MPSGQGDLPVLPVLRDPRVTAVSRVTLVRTVAHLLFVALLVSLAPRDLLVSVERLALLVCKVLGVPRDKMV